MPQPARLIWANNLDNPAGVTLAGTGHSEPIDLTAAEAVFLSVVVGAPPQDFLRPPIGLQPPRLIVRLQVRDAGGTWLPIAFVEPHRPFGHEPEPESIAQPNGYVSVGLSLSTYPGNQGYFGKTVPIVLPPTARIRWDAHRAEGSGRSYTDQPVPFGQTVISLYGR